MRERNLQAGGFEYLWWYRLTLSTANGPRDATVGVPWPSQAGAPGMQAAWPLPLDSAAFGEPRNLRGAIVRCTVRRWQQEGRAACNILISYRYPRIKRHRASSETG